LPEIECFAGQLNQVFMNIIVNAIDALDAFHTLQVKQGKTAIKPGRITISTKATAEDSILIQIADNGPGIPEKVRSKIFEPFFTTKPIGQGTGLGLSISYQIITDKHDGTIQCTSQPGQGTEFQIEIPIHRAKGSHPKAA
jgi:signal transduction histidine kinase